MDLLQWRNAAITQHRPDNRQRDRLQDRRLVSEDNLPQETVTISDDSTDDSSADDWKKGFDDSDVAAADGGSEPESSSFMFADGDPDLVGITEEKDAPVVEGQTDVVPLAPSSGQRGVMATSARKLAHLLEKNKDATPYKSNEFSAQAWSSVSLTNWVKILSWRMSWHSSQPRKIVGISLSFPYAARRD